MLIRTQLLLEDKVKQDLVAISRYKNLSISALVRSYVSEKVNEEKKVLKKHRKISAVASMRQMIQAAGRHKTYGPTDLARNHDTYLY